MTRLEQARREHDYLRAQAKLMYYVPLRDTLALEALEQEIEALEAQQVQPQQAKP